MNLQSDHFSVISLRKGTVSSCSPRTRLDLIVNTMFENAVRNREITVNNPSIWRPIISIEDATNAYIRAIEIRLEWRSRSSSISNHHSEPSARMYASVTTTA